MRLTRKLAPIATAAIAAMAFAAPSAVASGGSVAVYSDGAHTNPCPAVNIASWPAVTGGCQINVSSPSVKYQQDGLGTVATCAQSYKLNVDSTGHGWMSNIQLSGPGFCSSFAYCGVNEVQLHGNGSGSFHAHTDVCVNLLITAFNGEFLTTLNQPSFPKFTANNAVVTPSPHPAMQQHVTGTWSITSGNIHVVDAP